MTRIKWGIDARRSSTLSYETDSINTYGGSPQKSHSGYAHTIRLRIFSNKFNILVHARLFYLNPLHVSMHSRVLRFFVGKLGKVGDVEVVQGSGGRKFSI